MQKIQTDPTLYYVDKQTKRQVFHAKVHNVYHHYLCFTCDSFSFPEPPVPLAGEARARGPGLVIKLRWPSDERSLCEDNFRSNSLNEENTNVEITRIK